MHSQIQPLLPTISPSPGIEDGDFSEKINLDLGIGRLNEEKLKKKKIINREKKEPIFTDSQFDEFNKQIIVYKLISSSLPVPLHLFLPIWLSVHDSTAINKKYTSSTGLTSKNSDNTSIMDDSEPGRCKRTDGRKWRCSKTVVTNQKYCERHMHRGRRSSRKHVEPIKTVSKPNNIKTSAFDNTTVPTVSLGASDINHTISISLAPNRTTVKDTLTSLENGNNPRNVCRSRKRRMDKNNYVGLVSSGFGSSPTSVLSCAAGEVNMGSGSKNNVVKSEPQRCRRTDGKKWQCRRNTIQNEKYCEAHMNRGAKRLILNPESTCNNAPATSNRTAINHHDNRINLNTMPASPQHINGNDSSNSSSDATTITDENISISLA